MYLEKVPPCTCRWWPTRWMVGVVFVSRTLLWHLFYVLKSTRACNVARRILIIVGRISPAIGGGHNVVIVSVPGLMSLRWESNVTTVQTFTINDSQFRIRRGGSSLTTTANRSSRSLHHAHVSVRTWTVFRAIASGATDCCCWVFLARRGSVDCLAPLSQTKHAKCIISSRGGRQTRSTPRKTAVLRARNN